MPESWRWNRSAESTGQRGFALLGHDVDGIELGDVVYGIDLSRLRWRR